MKPIKIDYFNEKCPKCGTKVKYVEGTGHIFVGGSESYEDWHCVKHNFCPNCGEKMEREDKKEEYNIKEKDNENA